MNHLEKQNLFATPDSIESFQSYLENFNGSEAVVAMTCAGMAWNLACRLVAKELYPEIYDAISDVTSSLKSSGQGPVLTEEGNWVLNKQESSVSLRTLHTLVTEMKRRNLQERSN